MNSERIRTPCPACGTTSLFIGDDGHLVCGWIGGRKEKGCPDPTAINRARELVVEAKGLAGELRAMAEGHVNLGRRRGDDVSVVLWAEGWLLTLAEVGVRPAEVTG